MQRVVQRYNEKGLTKSKIVTIVASGKHVHIIIVKQVCSALLDLLENCMKRDKVCM